jgi:hypothetical protein
MTWTLHNVFADVRHQYLFRSIGCDAMSPNRPTPFQHQPASIGYLPCLIIGQTRAKKPVSTASREILTPSADVVSSLVLDRKRVAPHGIVW